MTKHELELFTFEKLLKATIAKDLNQLQDLISSDAEFFHFTEKPLNRDEYIGDIVNDLFTYYDYQIKHYENNQVILRVDATLYGSKRNWWIFLIGLEFKEEDNRLKLYKSQILA